MKKIFTILFLTICGFVNAQAPTWSWACAADESSKGLGYAISTDASGNVFAAGSFGFNGTAITFGTTTLTTVGNRDLFVVKYGASGNVLWAKSAGGISHDDPTGIAIDAGGNVLVIGSFDSPFITFGNITLTSASAYGNGSSDIFIVKYDPSGNVLWAKSAGGIYNDYGKGISTDADGNIFVTGSFVSPSINFGTFTLTNPGFANIFIVKYDALGNVLWAKAGAGTSIDAKGEGISADASGNVFVTGNYSYASMVLGTTTLTNAGITDIFTAKYDASGNLLWVRAVGGSSTEQVKGVSTDATGNVFITGAFQGPSITFGTSTLTNTDNLGQTLDVFIVKYDASGNVLWAKGAGGITVGGIMDDYGSVVSADASENVFLMGDFKSGTLSFGSTVLTNSSNSRRDIFIVKYDASGNVLWAKSAGGIEDDYGHGISADANGNVFVIGEDYSASITFGGTTLTNDFFVAKLNSIATCENSPSAAGVITGTASVCKGSADVSFSTPAISGSTSYLWTLPGGATGTSTTNSIAVSFGSNAVSGNIKVMGRNDCGMGPESMFAVTVNEIPATPVINLYYGTLESNSPSGNQWNFGNSIIPNATNSSFIPSLSGDYYVIVTINGCSSQQSNIISYINTGINAFTANNGISIYPNPTSGEIRIELNDKFESDYSVEVFDNAGILLQIMKKRKSEIAFVLDLGKFSSGQYTLRIKALNKFYQAKVIKE